MKICPVPWLHLFVGSEGGLRLCCLASDGREIRDQQGVNVNISNITSYQDVFNNHYMRGVRQGMMQGRLPDFCERCTVIESIGGTSERELLNIRYQDDMGKLLAVTEADGRVTRQRIVSLDFSLGNICNLKCRMCAPRASHKLSGDLKKAKIPHFEFPLMRWSLNEKFERLLPELLEHCRTINFQGGEPFLIPEHHVILQKIVDLGLSDRIGLSYNTNLTLLPPELLRLWRKFKSVHLNVSLEGYGALNEYIRHPSCWRKIDKHFHVLDKLRRFVPLEIEVHTVFQALNVLGLTDLFEYLRGWGSLVCPLPSLCYLKDPDYLMANHLPMELKLLARDRVNAYVARHHKCSASAGVRRNVDMLSTCLELMFRQPTHDAIFLKFLAYTRRLDHVRQENVVQIIPELSKFYDGQGGRAAE